MVTLVIPMMFSSIISATKILEGERGLSGLSTFPNLWVTVYLAAGASLLSLFGLRTLINTDYGLVFQAIGSNDQAVKSAAISTFSRKCQNVFIAGSIGAFVGAFNTHWIGFVGIPVFALDNSILPIASSVVGGIGTFAGAFIGAFILVPLSELLRGFGGARIVFYVVTLLIFIVAIPEGVFPFLRRKYHQFERLVETE